VHANCFGRREFEAIGVSPLWQFVKTSLDMSKLCLSIILMYFAIAELVVVHRTAMA